MSTLDDAFRPLPGGPQSRSETPHAHLVQTSTKTPASHLPSNVHSPNAPHQNQSRKRRRKRHENSAQPDGRRPRQRRRPQNRAAQPSVTQLARAALFSARTGLYALVSRDRHASVAGGPWPLPALSVPAMCACLAALVYVAATGFGTKSRSDVPLARALDGIAAVAGFQLNQIELSGQRQTDVNQAFAAIQAQNIRSLPMLDLEVARDGLRKLRWVRDARLVRVWPGTLRVTLVERRPFAIWSEAGKSRLIDRDGTVLQTLTTDTDLGLPVFHGPGAAETSAKAQAMIAQYPDLARAMAYAERVGNRRWRLVLTTGSRLELPETAAAGALAKVVSTPIWQRLLDGQLGVVDLRTPGRMLLRPRLRPAQTPSDT